MTAGLIAFLLISVHVGAAENALRARARKVELPPFVPAVSLAYSGVSNLNDASEGQVITHSVGAELGWLVTKSTAISAVGGVTYTSIDSEILKEDKSQLTDTYLGIGHTDRLGRVFTLGTSLGGYLPSTLR